MIKIEGTTIIMTRGDTLKTNVSIYDKEGNIYVPIEGETVRFALKKDYSDSYPLIIKDIPIDTLELKLEPKDTKRLSQPGEYVYDIQITLSDGTVDTFIPNAKLIIVEEVD